MAIPRGTYLYDYNDGTGHLAGITAPDGNGLSFTWDGFLHLSEAWSGQLSGSVTKTYDNNFWVTTRSVNGEPVSYSYDDDGLLTGAGSLTVTRDPANGLVTGTDLGGVAGSRAHNPYGELAERTVAVAGTDLYGVSYTRDKLGRIVEETETIEGETHTYQYAYDEAGRLSGVSIDGATEATYSYDANGNRTHVDGNPIATYDAQDRMLTYRGASYSYTANGELESRTDDGATTHYHYDVLGNLIRVDLPGDVTVEYIVDGRNRRIGKKVNGQLVQGFLYKDQLNPVAELDGQGNVVARFVYGDKSNVPAYMVKEGTIYRIVSDHLGSPRLVVNTAAGKVVHRMAYDAWGNVTQDTNSGFQPFGFAGGLYDQHTGLVRFGARDYSTQAGSWTVTDPIRYEGGDFNLYGYVAADPVNFTDATGLRKTVFPGQDPDDVPDDDPDDPDPEFPEDDNATRCVLKCNKAAAKGVKKCAKSCYGLFGYAARTCQQSWRTWQINCELSCFEG